jgi:hypothetical protein
MPAFASGEAKGSIGALAPMEGPRRDDETEAIPSSRDLNPL